MYAEHNYEYTLPHTFTLLQNLARYPDIRNEEHFFHLNFACLDFKFTTFKSISFRVLKTQEG